MTASLKYDDGGPLVWPECGVCGVAWVLRHTLIPGGFVWQRDCKHKNGEVVPVVRDE